MSCSKEDFDDLLREVDKGVKRARSPEPAEEEKLSWAEVDDSAQDTEKVDPPDYYQNQGVLDEAYFPRHGWYIRGSEEHAAFPGFYKRYLARLQPPPVVPPAPPEISARRRELGLPDVQKLHPRLRYPFQILSNKNRPIRVSRLKPAAARIVDDCIHVFESFQQRTRLERLRKLQEGKRALPMYPFKEPLLRALEKHDVVLIAGDTGCGKSTQVPQYLMERYNSIAVTQPRRIAATALARRVAYETQSEFGKEVGYVIRFEATRSKDTKVLFLTEGVLLRHLESGDLPYDVIVVDEVHERNLTTDFLLGCLRQRRSAEQKFKWVLMSATINIKSFVTWLGGDCKVFEVPGRLHPIDLKYIECDAGRDPREKIDDKLFLGRGGDSLVEAPSNESKVLDTRPYIKVLRQIEQDFDGERGDVLIFVSGTQEIETLCGEVTTQFSRSWVVLPLHAGLPVEEQDKVFHVTPQGMRKVVVATNVAETSITVDGIRFVIDSGKVKQMEWNAEMRMSSLQECWVSKASAKQRMGRAGRTGPGRCYRLYSEAEYAHFSEFTLPQIHRTPIEAVLLQIKAMGLGDPRAFPYIEKPSSGTIEGAMRSLVVSDCLTPPPSEAVTPMGALLAQLPVELPLGKMVVLAVVFRRVTDPMLTIAASLTLQSIFRHTADLTPGSPEHNSRHLHDSPHGDPFTALNVFEKWMKLKQTRPQETRGWCRKHFVNEHRLYEVAKIKRQFIEMLGGVGLIPKDQQVIDSNLKREKRRRLRELRSQQQHDAGRKKLTRNRDDDDDDREDVYQLDFEANYEVDEFFVDGASRGKLSDKQVQLIQGIIAYALYENFAIPAEGNTNRRGTEQLFHTRERENVAIHPSSGLFGHVDIVPAGADIAVYQRLLETGKAYLIANTKVPLVPAVLLCARHIDMPLEDGSFWGSHTILVDHYLLITFPKSEAREQAVAAAVKLRRSLALAVQGVVKKCQAVIHDPFHDPPSYLEKLPSWLRHAFASPPLLTEEVEKDLAYYMSFRVQCTVRRLVHAEVVPLLVPPEVRTSHADELALHGSAPRFKGGISVTSYLTYASVLPQVSSSSAAGKPALASISLHVKTFHKCPHCGKEGLMNSAEVAEHEAACQKKSRPAPLPPSSSQGERRRWECPSCERTFLFTDEEAKHHDTHCMG